MPKQRLLTNLKHFFEDLGTSSSGFIIKTGEMFIMLYRSVALAFVPPFKLRNTFKQMEFVGVQSLFVVILTGSFTGMVLAIQSFEALNRFGAESLVGPAVALSMTRELGPVLTGLMVMGRAGSAMATEIGTMRVTEQIDAIYTMALNPVKYLVTPRIIAGICMLPVLAVVSDAVGIFGGYMIGTKMLGIDPGAYMGRTYDYLKVDDILNGLVKAMVFGLIISLVSCYHGFYAKGGAEGVGRAATSAVVLGCVLILVFDYVLTSLMFG